MERDYFDINRFVEESTFNEFDNLINNHDYILIDCKSLKEERTITLRAEIRELFNKINKYDLNNDHKFERDLLYSEFAVNRYDFRYLKIIRKRLLILLIELSW